MIVSATISCWHALSTSFDYEQKLLDIKTTLYGVTIKRSFKVSEIPAFIEHLEISDTFLLDDGFYITLNDNWRQRLLSDLRNRLKAVGESA